MKYIMTLFWSFLLVNVLGYVVSSIQATDYSFALVSILSVIVAIIIWVIDAILPKNEAAAEHH